MLYGVKKNVGTEYLNESTYNEGLTFKYIVPGMLLKLYVTVQTFDSKLSGLQNFLTF